MPSNAHNTLQFVHHNAPTPRSEQLNNGFIEGFIILPSWVKSFSISILNLVH